jgi:putative colanic acid biosynthesis UDP-glucose lipid carrier transferase
MPINSSRYIPNISILGDLLILNAVFVFYYIAVFTTQPIESNLLLFFIFLNACWLLFSYIMGALKIDRHTSRLKLITVTTQIFVFYIVAFLAYFQWNSEFVYLPKEQKQVQFLVFYVALMSWKIVLHYSYFFYRKSGVNHRTMLLVGDTPETHKLMTFINENAWHGYTCPGIISISEDVSSKNSIGSLQTLDRLIAQYKADEIFIAMEILPEIKNKELSGTISNLPVDIRLIPNLGDFPYFSLETFEFGNTPVLALYPSPLSYVSNKIIKRVFDVIFSTLIMLVVLSWLIPLLWLMDLLGKRNGVFFIQRRTSIYGKDFNIIKFRTMVPNALADVQQALEKDTRITPLGSFLRKTSIDELPQFINVWKGNMSVVGPRPHMLSHTESYKKVIPTFMQRHVVKPGITGMAQVSGFRGEIKTTEDINRRVELDLAYIRQWSLWLDVQIIGKTIWLIFKPTEEN